MYNNNDDDQEEAVTIWEYKFLTSENDDIGEFMNRLNVFGADGWELVGIIPATERNYLSAYLKKGKKPKKGRKY